jgi:hypothetical protein
MQVQRTLEIRDESVILNSHETYEQRKELFDHMNKVVSER